MLFLFINASSLNIGVSPSPSKIDLGQPVAVNVVWSGGTPPYNVILYANSSFGSNCSGGYTANSITGVNGNSITLYNVPASSGKLDFCAEIIDYNGIKAYTGIKADKKSGDISVYNDTSVVITTGSENRTFYNGESITFKSKAYNGIEPYSYNWTIPSGLSGSCKYNKCKLVANSLTAGQEDVKVVATDNSSLSASNSMEINITVLSASIFPSNPTIDYGQSVTFNAIPTGGSGKYEYAWYNDSSCANASIEGKGSDKNQYTTIPITSNAAYCVKISDSKTHLYAIASSNIIVNPYPEVTLEGAYSVLGSAQIGVLSAAISGGTSPYTYNFSVYNSMTNEIISNALYHNQSASNTFEWQLPASGLGPAYANVIISDSSYVTGTANSINSNMTADYLPKLRIMPFSAVINSSQSLTFSYDLSGGTGPFSNSSGSFSSITYSVLQNGNATSNAIISGNDIQFRSPGTYNITGSVIVNNLITVYSGNAVINVGAWNNMSIVNVQLPSNSVSDFNYMQSNATIHVATSNSITANVLIRNVTSSVNSAPDVTSNPGTALSKLVALNISVTSGTINSISSINVTVGYPQSYTSPAPYRLNGTSWTEITPFSVNAVSHTITFSISPDPVVGVFGFVQVPQLQQAGGTPIYGSGGTGVAPGSYNPGEVQPVIANPPSNSIAAENNTNSTQSRNATTYNSTAQNSTTAQTQTAAQNTLAGNSSSTIFPYNAFPEKSRAAPNASAESQNFGFANDKIYLGLAVVAFIAVVVVVVALWFIRRGKTANFLGW